MELQDTKQHHTCMHARVPKHLQPASYIPVQGRAHDFVGPGGTFWGAFLLLLLLLLLHWRGLLALLAPRFHQLLHTLSAVKGKARMHDRDVVVLACSAGVHVISKR